MVAYGFPAATSDRNSTHKRGLGRDISDRCDRKRLRVCRDCQAPWSTHGHELLPLQLGRE